MGWSSESRYLLLLTENYGALTILQQEILKKQKAITIFGSSFPSDQEYTQVCRNINRIKVCMETGNTVVLLNLENLYESLYDALNQYYVEFGGERYVDLGLGTHRVKCRVHKDFKLIVVAEKQIVYDKFPIPLINRLEKHFLNVSTMLTEEQLKLTQELEKWAKDFVKTQVFSHARQRKDEFSVGDVFMGYHADSCAAIVLHVYQQHYLEGQVFDSAKRILMWCATPDAVMRLCNTALVRDEAILNTIYWKEQQHQSLSAYLYQKIRQESRDSHFAQVTTHSKLITSVDLEELSHKLGIPNDNMVLLNLQSFDTEQQFCRQVKMCFERIEQEMLLIVQSDCGDENASLVACARYCIQDELQQLGNRIMGRRHAIFIIQLPRIAGGCFNGFQCGHWHSLHIDDLRPEGDTLGMSEMRGKSVGTLIHHAVQETAGRPTEVLMETDIPEEEDNQHAQMDVDEEDIHLNFNNVERYPSNPTHSHKLPVENLVLSCIQAALAMVKDTKEDTKRSTDRVQQLLDLLHYGKANLVSNNLVKGICKHLDVLMMEKEKSAVNPANWLAAEAAKAEVINTAGTFRRAWTQCLETKVTPILMGIIAFMDTNRNLESLYKAKDGDWVQQLWLGILNNTKATCLQYSQLVSPGHTQQELPEVVVQHTGTDGHLFTAQLPFSWLYFRLIEDLLSTTINNKPDTDCLEVVNSVKDILASQPLGIMLYPLMDRDRRSVLKAYINDFVHMMYPVSSKQEHQLICESVHIGSGLILQHQTGDGMAMLVAIHLAYLQTISRFRNFSSLSRVWPECSESIIDFQDSSPNFFLCSSEEMTLDVMGLRLLLEKLEPEKETLNRVQSRADWLQRVRRYRPVVERLLDMVHPEHTVQCGPRCVKGIQEARLTWTSVLVVKLFIEHVYSVREADDKFTINRCMPLWTMMKTGADMKSLESLKKVEKFLKMCNKLAVSHYFDINRDDKCEHCENEMEGPPVYLPCKDKICSRCYHDITIIKDLVCPVCRAEIPANLKANEDLHKSDNCTLSPVLQCVEDVYHQDVSKSETPENKEVHMATRFLENSQNYIAKEGLDVVKLYTLAETRFALSVVAKYVQKIFVDRSIKMKKNHKQMMKAAAKLCEECNFDWPCIFFIKQLCRCYGRDSYQTVLRSGDENMRRWLQLLNLDREEALECTDLYVVCGEQYITCREMVTQCLLGQDPANLLQQLEDLRNEDWKKRVTLLLAVYREITMSNVYPEDKRKTQPQMYEQLLDALLSHPLFQAQGNLLKALFRNTIWQRCQHLNIHQGMALKDQSIACLLVHAGITFLQIPDDKSLLQPLITLALLPQNMARSFLPTMPQDDMTQIKEALLAARDQTGAENPVIYRCPNGHPYIIGNCGRPATKGQCKDCGADIGGLSYVLSQGNVLDDGTDRTKPGHILGRADQRTDIIVDERKMTAVSCAILRFLTHISMLLGTNENPQVVCDMIKPDIPNNSTVQFLINHIKLDIASLQRVTGRSVDEVLLLMHRVLSSVTQTYNNGGAQKAEICNLVTKEARNQWEDLFCKHCLSPLLQDMESTIKSCNSQLKQDKRLGSNPLLCLLYEIDTPKDQVSAVALHQVASVWRYRSRISMDHLTTVFHTKMGKEHKILKLFLQEDYHLRAIRLVPSILRLQRMLIHKYQRKLDRAEATAFTVEHTQMDFIQDFHNEEEHVNIYIPIYLTDCTLLFSACPIFPGIARVSKEFCSKQITDNTPISMLLPTKRDAGLCSYVLVYFLLKKQKSFLEDYCKAKRQSVSDLPKVKVHDLSPAHLISYHPDRDILPIVLANCNYSFEVGKGTKIEYDFGNIERQLGDRFLFAKSDIDIDEIEVMTYRSDVTNAVVFKTLREKIPQLVLPVSPKSRAVCQCQHVQCLWLTLAQEKTKRLAKHKKDVFDSLGEEFRKELSDQQRQSLQYFCDGLQADKVDFLMEFLFECIMLMIAIPQNQDDEDYIDILGQSLQDNLQGYLYSPMYDEEPILPDWMAEVITRLDIDNGEKLLVSQCVDVWLFLFNALHIKETERRF
ncbi:E3 ubiquitin-protein ligase RNF213-like [Ylistrum balloti]|uniref:E3 ubiquitin-protein ligase RNF213-like n=1 Tax=Ylistrum balloti TaxID=509963 RepID=UPI0029059B9D|nr:E3 ubiquitin-protein ligase RNF213-like [Ylistrum balloti]